MTLDQLNQLSPAEFTAHVGPVFECSPWIAERSASARPFGSVEALHGALMATVRGSSDAEQLGLIQAHPDLVGRAARAGTLTPESTREQASAGLDNLSEDEVAVFDHFNRAYRERFGFPFILCARQHKKASMLAAFPVRLRNNRADEIATALGEIAKIARFRLADLLTDER